MKVGKRKIDLPSRIIVALSDLKYGKSKKLMFALRSLFDPKNADKKGILSLVLAEMIRLDFFRQMIIILQIHPLNNLKVLNLISHTC